MQQYKKSMIIGIMIILLLVGIGLIYFQKEGEKSSDSSVMQVEDYSEITTEEEIESDEDIYGEKVEEGFCGNSVNWCLYEDGIVYISGEGEMQEFESETSIAASPWKGNTEITAVYVDEGVTSIGKNAFADCANLKTVYIAESVTCIYEGAFKNTAWLTTKQNEDPLVVVNDILIDGQKAEGAIYLPSEIKRISNQAFMGNQALTDINLVHIEEIGESAFENCINLQNVLGLENVNVLGKGAFQNCASIIEIKLYGIIEKLENDTFKDCIALKTVSIPGCVNQIGESTFAECPNLVLIVDEDSAGYDYAEKKGIPYGIKSQSDINKEVSKQAEKNLKDTNREIREYVKSLKD